MRGREVPKMWPLGATAAILADVPGFEQGATRARRMRCYNFSKSSLKHSCNKLISSTDQAQRSTGTHSGMQGGSSTTQLWPHNSIMTDGPQDQT